MSHGLVVDDKVQEHFSPGQDVPHAAREPGVQAVGVDGQGYGNEFLGFPGGQFLEQRLLQHGQLAKMAQHGHASGCRPDGRGAHHQHLPHLILQLADALGDGGLGQKQGPGGFFEALFGDDRGQGLKLFGVEH